MVGYLDRTIGDSEESKSFKVQLMEYWSQKNMSNIKIPQIGGRELDFFKLYKAVIKRGGAQAVSNNKMWKEIVNEFGFPSTCTSASFTLRNHYTRFLLGYEQKYFFNKDDDEALPLLCAGRKRKRKEERNDGSKGDSSGSESESGEEELKDSSEKKVKSNNGQALQKTQMIGSQMVRPPGMRQNFAPVMRMENGRTEIGRSNLHKQMTEAYKLNSSNARQEIFYTKKNKMFPMVPDMKRISLAFESYIQDEITFALNSLLLYSVNSIHPIVLESHGNLLDSLLYYLEICVKNVPSLNKILKYKEIKPKIGGSSYPSYSDRMFGQSQYLQGPPSIRDAFSSLNVFDNYNFGVCEILLYNAQKNQDISPLTLIQRKKQENELTGKEKVGEVSLLEQIRQIFLILRNFSYTKSNEIFMAKNEKLIQLSVQLFVLNCDQQVTKYILDILANITKYMQLSNITDYKSYCERLFEVLNVDTSEELESAVEVIRNLIAIPENETTIESYLNSYIDQVTRLMLQAQGDIREGILEFLCFLSDLKMTTRVQLARHPKLIMRLVGLLTSGIARYSKHSVMGVQEQTNSSSDRNQEKITKLAALTLSNISLAPLSRAYLKPFERDLFVVASTDETVTKYLANILSELVNYDPEADPERQSVLNVCV